MFVLHPHSTKVSEKRVRSLRRKPGNPASIFAQLSISSWARILQALTIFISGFFYRNLRKCLRIFGSYEKCYSRNIYEFFCRKFILTYAKSYDSVRGGLTYEFSGYRQTIDLINSEFTCYTLNKASEFMQQMHRQ